MHTQCRLPRRSHRRLRITLAVAILSAGILAGVCPSAAQPALDAAAADRIQTLIEDWKTDRRGPYAGIRWFCPDGSVIPAQQRCDAPGGIQHALLKDEAQRLRDRYGLYLGQILAGTDTQAFWNGNGRHTRLKQYQLGAYLYRVDDGWILRRAQHYRGAFQAEDEAAWGRSFLVQMLEDDDRVRSHFFLLRQAVRDLPHGADGTSPDVQQRIRATATDIAEAVPAFMPLRVKIHGQPGPEDLERVRTFLETHGDTLDDEVAASLERLEQDLTAAYETTGADRLARPLSALPADHDVTQAAQALVDAWPSLSAAQRIERGSTVLLQLRRTITTLAPPDRLAALDLSLALETELLRRASTWTPRTRRALLAKGRALARATAGSGHIELWEWNRVASRLPSPSDSVLDRETFADRVNALRRVAEWGTAMVSAHYRHVVERYATFEPKARGFIDARVRSSVLLPLGNVAGRLGTLLDAVTGRQHQLLDVSDTGRIRGLTPGVVAGTLRVVTETPRAASLEQDDIYVLPEAPPDLPPVAGLLTTAENNVVSHVQLLARNLGIPTASLPDDQTEALASYDGTRVFFAVSPGGTVRLVPAGDMTDAERRLVAPDTTRSTVHVSVDALDLSRRTLPSLTALQSDDGGRIVGPKAANLGQLKSLFPDRVASGFAVPFGVFRAHMDQPMPGTDGSYWDYLQATFDASAGPALTPMIRARLDTLRRAIRTMPLRPSFRSALRATFQKALGAPMGEAGVFLRSDTNMEDLPGFTGAGLNLTVPNVVDASSILDAIRRVWASPYTERSYRWRQRVLQNPAHVYPSVLIQRAVSVETSGVLITTGVSQGTPDALTASFSRGVGGAVKGEATEVTLLQPDGDDVLLSPLRTPRATVLPPEGGTAEQPVTFHRPVLTASDRDTLRRLARTLRDRLPSVPGVASEGPYDVELGFRDGHLWVFQVRPFVEATQARSQAYFRRLDARAEPQDTVDLAAPRND